MRRVILLLSVGCLPPSLRPSGACLSRGSSVLYKPQNAAEGDTPPGLRLFRCTLAHLSASMILRDAGHQESSGSYTAMGPSLAMAHRTPGSSRAMATVTPWAC
jgi:hypothetical protein